MAKLKLCILISGRGSNLKSLIDACKAKDFPAEIALVISNDTEAYGLKRAEESRVPNYVISHKEFSTRDHFDDTMAEKIKKYNVDLICLAGFMRILGDKFIDQWKNKIINIHPSLLPSFKGMNVHQRVIDSGVKFSGCTFHFVRCKMDSGPILLQAIVPVLPGDDAKTLAARILKQEHRVYPKAIKMIASGRVKITNEKVIIDGAYSTEECFINPLL